MSKGVTVKKTTSKTEKKRIVNMRFFSVVNDAFDLFYLILKRGTDIIFGIIGCIFTVPIMVIVKVSYLLHSDTAPVFYAQERIGKNGNIFKLYKFRTMVTDAEELLKELLKNPELKSEWDKYQKLENDPRITKMGKILRKTSLDEFPQFLNILKGDMSLVGPRPLTKGELDKHNGNHEIYEKVRPGITGWWAANGRSDVDYEERLSQEYFYVENRSLLLDLKCIVKTAKGVLFKEGAK